MHPVERFVSAGGVDCDACGSLTTDGVYCTAWIAALTPRVHFCDGCWANTATDADAEPLTLDDGGASAGLVRIVGADGVPVWADARNLP